jgi:nucleoid DNA-binding protein
MAKGFTQDFTLLCRRTLGCDVWTSRAVMRLWAEFATQELCASRRIEMQGFGSFRLVKRKYNFGGVVTVVKFQPSTKLRKTFKKYELSTASKITQ